MKMKSLLVEDDYITSEVMREILLSFGDCDVADDGIAAIELFKNSLETYNHYSVVFLDIMMPELDGQEVLTMIRKLEDDYHIQGLDCTKIVMTTALDDFDNIRNAFFHQCEGYLVKPVDKDKVVNMLAEFELLV